MERPDLPLEDDILAQIQQSPLCYTARVVESDSFAPEKFYFKIRAELVKGYNFQARIYANRSHIDYSYQLFQETHLLCWDNKEEYSQLRTFPHHHHLPDNSVVESPLSGNPRQDIRIVLHIVECFLTDSE